MRLPFALCLCLTLVSCRVFHEDVVDTDVAPIESANFGDMRNVSRVGDLWFGSTPNAGDLDLAKRRGIRTVIDLAVPEEDGATDARGVSAELGLRYFDVGLAREEFLDDETVDLVLAQLAAEDNGPFLLFCGTGGRCAMLVAIHRVVVLGVPVEKALEDARHAGMEGGAPADFVRAQIARLTLVPSTDEAPQE